MNTFSAAMIDTLAKLTEEEFHSRPQRDRLMKELNRMTSMIETVHELFLLEKSTLFHTQVADHLQAAQAEAHLADHL